MSRKARHFRFLPLLVLATAGLAPAITEAQSPPPAPPLPTAAPTPKPSPGVSAIQAMSRFSCALSGSATMPKDTVIYDKEGGGSGIARFAGVQSPLATRSFPARSSAGRVQVQTGLGSGSFQIRGFVDATKVPLFTGRDVPVTQGHVWIGAGQQVQPLGATQGQLQVSLALKSPIQQTFTGQAPCGAFTLRQLTAPGWTVPGGARGYVVRKTSVDLYDSPSDGRKMVTSLHRAAEGHGILLWSTERQGPWVHVEYHGEVVLNAWAHAKDLHPLPPGETMDHLNKQGSKSSAARMVPEGKPKLLKTSKSVPLRSSASASAPAIGHIEPDTETYVIDVVAGWASVLPKALNILPYGDGHFWVLASDLGI
jgi:hypothetical protein